MTPVLRAAGLMYHDIVDDTTRSGFQRPGARAYRLSPETFERHLSAIARTGAVPVVVTGSPFTPGARLLYLTFDDGGASAMYAADALERRGWRGHFFIVTDRIGTPGFLTRAEIRELHTRGHIVGSHSHTHPDIIRDLPRAVVREEWRRSLAILAEILGRRPVVGSVPGGDASRMVYEAAADAGLRYLFTSEAWLTPRRARSCWIVGRVALKHDMDAATARRLAAFRGWTRARMLRTTKGILRRALAPLYRRYVRGTTVPSGGSTDRQRAAGNASGAGTRRDRERSRWGASPHPDPSRGP